MVRVYTRAIFYTLYIFHCNYEIFREKRMLRARTIYSRFSISTRHTHPETKLLANCFNFPFPPKRVGRRINVDIAKVCNKVFFLNVVNTNTIVRKCPSDSVFIKSRKNHLIWQVVNYYSDLRSWRKMLWDYFKICLEAEN